MSLTNYQKVVDFNTKFGVPIFTAPQHNIFTENPKLVSLRYNLIAEETKELNQGVKNRDWVECIDALGDMLYVAYGLACSFGVNADIYFKELLDKFPFDLNNQLSNFENVKNLRTSLNNVNNTKSQLNIFDNEEFLNLIEKVNYRLEIIQNKIKNKEFEDVIHNLLYYILYTYETGSLMGCNMDEAFRLIHESNMSKLCSSEEVAQETVQWYKERPELGYLEPAYRKGDDGEYWVVYNASSGKILKSVRYHPVNLTVLLN